jgi:ribosomal protein S12 methylthiotransferase accessory factor YcaO
MRRCSEQLLQVVGPVSMARLHGRACWYCGAVARGMQAAGRVQRSLGQRVWTVMSCGCHPKPEVAVVTALAGEERVQ